MIIGGDSCGSGCGAERIRSDSKVFKRGELAFGYTSSYRMGQLLRYSLKVPDRGIQDWHEYMSTRFVDAVRECLKSGGMAKVENGVEVGGIFIVASAQRLFKIYDDFQVGETSDTFDATGCGEDYALGALAVQTKAEFEAWTPKEQVRRALLVAERYSAGVKRPFKFVETLVKG